jgi:hypothetical protein
MVGAHRKWQAAEISLGNRAITKWCNMTLLRSRRGRPYFYKTYRVGKKLRNRYVGSGAFAEFAAFEAAELKAQRQAIAQGFRCLKESYTDSDRVMGEFNRLADSLIGATLLVAGFHRAPARKEWRRHCYGKRRSS